MGLVAVLAAAAAATELQLDLVVLGLPVKGTMAQRVLLVRQDPAAAAAVQELRVPLVLRAAVVQVALDCQIQSLDLLYSTLAAAVVQTTLVLLALVEMAAAEQAALAARMGLLELLTLVAAVVAVRESLRLGMLADQELSSCQFQRLITLAQPPAPQP